METTGFNSIRIYQEPDYSLAVDDFGNLYMTEVDKKKKKKDQCK